MKNELLKLRINKLKNQYASVDSFDFTNIINQHLADFYLQYGEHIVLGGDPDDFSIMLDEFIDGVENELKLY